MTVLWMRLRADLRGRWRATAALALLLGIIGGIVLTAAAGARRTDTAYPRLLQWANASQVTVVVTDPDPDPHTCTQTAPFTAGGPGAEAIRRQFFAALARLPEVASAARATQYNTALPVPHGQPDPEVQVFASPDGSLGVTGDAVKITQGRMFAPGTPGQAIIDADTAKREHLQPGSMLRLIGIPKDGCGTATMSRAVPLSFRVTGIAVFDDKIVPATTTTEQPRILLSPPFAATNLAVTMTNLPEEDIRLRAGATMAAFAHDADTLRKRYGIDNADYTTITLSDQVAAAQRAIEPQAAALAIFAALTAVIGLAVIGQLLIRQLTLDTVEFPVLRAVGMTRGQLATVALGRLAIVTASGGVLAVAIAVAASPLMPIGPARLAEPHPGVSADPAVLILGFAVIMLLPLALLSPVAWRAAGRRAGPPGDPRPDNARRASRIAAALAGVGAVTSGIGIRMAFEPGRGRTAVPVRTALGGTVVAVTALTAALVFGSSLIGLVSTPARYGQNWDQQLDLGYANVPGRLGAQALATDDGLTGYAGGNNGELSIGRLTVPAIGLDPVRGTGYITVLAGRLPAVPGEIALGPQTMGALHTAIGRQLQVRVAWEGGSPGPAAIRTMRVTGTVVLPAFGLPALQETDLGTGAIVATSLLSAPMPDLGCLPGLTCYGFFLLRHKPGTDLAAGAARLVAYTNKFGCPPGQCTVVMDQRPGGIRNYAGIRDTPLALGAVLVLLAVGTLAHVLLTSVRRRRRDLATLKVLGLTRSQVIRAVAWQASAFAAVALLIGLPLGVVAGRQAWRVFAYGAGVSPAADVPTLLVLLAIPVTLALANLIAAWPGWLAARIRPAPVFRSQ